MSIQFICSGQVYRYWWLTAYHINNLLEREPECEVDCIRVVVDRALQVLVILQQVIQQPALVRPAIRPCKIAQYSASLATETQKNTKLELSVKSVRFRERH